MRSLQQLAAGVYCDAALRAPPAPHPCGCGSPGASKHFMRPRPRAIRLPCWPPRYRCPAADVEPRPVHGRHQTPCSCDLPQRTNTDPPVSKGWRLPPWDSFFCAISDVHADALARRLRACLQQRPSMTSAVAYIPGTPNVHLLCLMPSLYLAPNRTLDPLPVFAGALCKAYGHGVNSRSHAYAAAVGQMTR